MWPSIFIVALLWQQIDAGEPVSPSVPTARIRNGTIRGRYLKEFEQDLFLGIPFADAPRLDNPQPINKGWTTPFDASEYGSTCYGFGSNRDLHLSQSEDCLNLNIIRPRCCEQNKGCHGFDEHNVGGPLPVLVWIYGGGWTQGSNADPMWNLSYVVQTSIENHQPVIAVSINYRLSFLGFPVGTEAAEAGIANLALKDQRIALQWIQENIAAFGGDPEKVTIWGESAGGCSTAWHLISYGGTGSKGLFRSAIMSSGVIFGTSNPKFPEDLNTEYEQIVDHANCTGAPNKLDCLRAVPISSIYPFESTVPNIGPVVDGDFIQREPALELDAGNVFRVPIIAGANSEEGLYVVNLIGSPSNVTALRELISEYLYALSNDTIDALLTAYPPGAPAPPYALPPDYNWCGAMEAANLSCTPEYRRTAAIFGDYFADAGRRYMAERWSKLGLPTYSYRFAAYPTSIPIEYWNNLGPGFSEHGVDLAYSFRLPGGFTTPIRYYPPVKPVPAHEYLSKVMVSKWISFAHSLDPNSYMRKLLHTTSIRVEG